MGQHQQGVRVCMMSLLECPCLAQSLVGVAASWIYLGEDVNNEVGISSQVRSGSGVTAHVRGERLHGF